MIRCSICGCWPAGLYPAGYRCADCTPARCAGRDEPPTPDPELTLDGLRKAAGLWTFKATDTALNDQRAIASGKRRSSPAAYRAARDAQQTRKNSRNDIQPKVTPS